ncbi:DUF4190 domain-containing protein [Couchioplanes caeruleus]|uniref:DUF4190 domain-containing protein n=1 Tax=Couchioplanes caeruleus TaxID=56438 RepID=UPI0020BE8C9A|nr:DUF4190 domain-containing protein [Couchioplanes caeruleus]UQU63022.1 DUF4190 domain-containing protein [Couchioplanes caeruleus]
MTQQPHPQPYANQPGPYAAQPFPPVPGFAPPPPQAHPGTNGFAIASLIFGILGGVLFATVFGIVGLVQTRRRHQRGKGLAITGLVLAGCWVTAIIVGVAIAVATDDTSTGAAGTPGSITNGAADSRGRVPATKLLMGDCISKLHDVGSRDRVAVVPCSRPHEGEVYATFSLEFGDYPGEKAVQKQADERCTEELDRYARAAADGIDVYYRYPTEDSWFLDQGITCIAGDPSGPRTGSLRD